MEEAKDPPAPVPANKKAPTGPASSTPVTREALYEEVWTEPMTAVAARYGVSGSFLARVCARLNVPRPPRGYWARHASGKATLRLALPEARPQDELAWSRGGEPVRAPRPLPKPPEATRRPRRRPAAARPSVHPLIRGAREHFDAARERDEYLRPSKKLLVDLVVSKGTLARALEVANELFLSSRIAVTRSASRPRTSDGDGTRWTCGRRAAGRATTRPSGRPGARPSSSSARSRSG